ncbi:MAG: Gfo/Idh/MocA family oxidoreductase [Lachnospiraceae bacterium]|nr:Gfo/Idh/MocA family oxidoreductase [Lachnospiraceae bacterium]
MEKIKWGILGTANIARWGMIPGMKLASNCEMYAIAGRSLEKARSFAEQFGFEKYYGSYDELLADENVQAVYVPLPNDIHLKWVEAALKAGKHVLCEKPMALNADEARRMYATAKECGHFLMEAYAYLHSPYIKSLKNDIDSGIIGDVDYIDTSFVTQGYKEDFRLHKEFGGGAMYDLGCYCTTMILSLIDSEPEFVKADAEFSDLGVDFMTAGIIRFANGARAAFNVGMILGANSNSRYDRLYIHGTKGAIRSDVEYNQAGELKYRIFTNEGVTERCVSVPQNYSLEVEQLGRCILEGEKPHITPEFSIKNAELIDKVLYEIGY